MRFPKKWFQQADKIEWVVLIASLLFVVPLVLRQIIGGFWATTLPQTIKVIGWMVAVFISFVIGIRGVRLNGLKGKPISYLIVGTTLSISLLGINIAVLVMVPKTLDLVRTSEERMMKLESMLDNPNLESERKAFVSSFIASEKYKRNGELVAVYDKDGDLSEYVPTESDQAIREGRTRLECQLGSVKKATFITASIIIISILVGALTPIKRKEVYTN